MVWKNYQRSINDNNLTRTNVFMNLSYVFSIRIMFYKNEKLAFQQFSILSGNPPSGS